MKTIIITGASRGIGRQIAITFKNKGYNVIATYLNSVNEAKELNNLGIDTFKVDVSLISDVESLFCYALKKYNGVDLLVNNAGISLPQKFILDITDTEVDSVLGVNLKGVFNCVKVGVKHMLSKGGSIINVSSIYGLIGGSCESVYSATKFGVIGLTKSVALELSNSNLSISAVCPGLIDTQMNANLSLTEKEEFLKEFSLKKIGTVNDVANKVYKISNLPFERKNGKIFKVCVGKI